MNSSGLPSLLAGSLKLTFQTQPLPWREERSVESSPQSDNNWCHFASSTSRTEGNCILSPSCLKRPFWFGSFTLSLGGSSQSMDGVHCPSTSWCLIMDPGRHCLFQAQLSHTAPLSCSCPCKLRASLCGPNTPTQSFILDVLPSTGEIWPRIPQSSNTLNVSGVALWVDLG